MTTQRRCARSWRRGGLAWVCAAALVAAMCVPHAASADDANKTKEIEAAEHGASLVLPTLKLIRLWSDLEMSSEQIRTIVEEGCQGPHVLLKKLNSNPKLSWIPFKEFFVNSVRSAIYPFCMLNKHWDKVMKPQVEGNALDPPQAVLDNSTLLGEYINQNLRDEFNCARFLGKFLPAPLDKKLNLVIDVVIKFFKNKSFLLLSELVTRIRNKQFGRETANLIDKVILRAIKELVSISKEHTQEYQTQNSQSVVQKPKPQIESKPDPLPAPNMTSVAVAEQLHRKNRKFTAAHHKHPAKKNNSFLIILTVLAALVAVSAGGLFLWRQFATRNDSQEMFRLHHDAPETELEAIRVDRGKRGWNAFGDSAGPVSGRCTFNPTDAVE